MKDGLKVALAVIAGYYLGRHHKLRLALVLALAILAARLKGEGAAGALLEQVPKILGGAAPDLGKITERVRGDLLDVGKAAAMRATSHQIDNLSDKLHERAEALRQPKGRGRAAEEEAEEEERPEEGRRRVPRRRPQQREPEPEEAYEEEEEYEEEPSEEEAEEPEPEERRRPRIRPSRPVIRKR
ncbi:hypothetical protein [Microbispora bryophytorum]|uniref:Uncharacterized protein n=1 Tax=Microbispora bryophytorum TaxID=1460882 RepID=A0A8H9LCY3_9ACTN|nr:hypothetical protein [Microbispora bryophytorum]MBD3140423.1 hypothetical protein [Microbispora bryophytorum]TQS02507.1 hypothetical protein FLX07_28460 [Microbispora bryophytorum]GGO27902.1 hypothetical protein GCM10011574_61760 [Microbispora bryophytorum]